MVSGGLQNMGLEKALNVTSVPVPRPGLKFEEAKIAIKL